MDNAHMLENIPMLPLDKLEQGGRFLLDRKSGTFRFIPKSHIGKAGKTPLLLAPKEERKTISSLLFVTYPKVTCHPLSDDVATHVSALTTLQRSRQSALARKTVFDGVFRVAPDPSRKINQHLICTTFSGPWTAVHTQTLDSCGRHGYLESHQIFIFDFPTLIIQWFGKVTDMPDIPNLVVMWATASPHGQSVVRC